MQQQTQYAPQVQPSMQPQHVVYVQTVPAAGPSIRPNFAAKAAMALSAIQLAIGILCLLLNSIAIGVYGYGNSYGYGMYTVNPVGAGIWCGILFIITGALGFGAAKSKTSCLIISFMVMCIISAVFTVPIFTVSGIEVSISSSYYYNYDRHMYIKGAKANTGINATMLILALVELIIAIIASTLCCNAVCGCCVTPSVGAVHYPNQPNAAAYAQTGTPGMSYYTQPVAYPMQPNTVMLGQFQGQPMAATQPTAVGQGPQATAPGPATLNRSNGNTMPPAYSENIPQKQ